MKIIGHEWNDPAVLCYIVKSPQGPEYAEVVKSYAGGGQKIAAGNGSANKVINCGICLSEEHRIL